MIGCVRWFLYKRPDSLGGAGSVINWKTNADNKMQTYSELRDSLMLRRLELRSVALVQQMQAIVEDQGWLGAGSDTGENDDLVSALVLAHHPWVDPTVGRRSGLIARGMTWDSVHAEPPKGDVADMLMWIFSKKMKEMHKPQTRKEKF